MNYFSDNWDSQCLLSGISNVKKNITKIKIRFDFLSDNWEVPFENISDLQWLGSGAQGAVFVGKLDNELIAVKKVKEEKDASIHHLRKLNHPNIIQVLIMVKVRLGYKVRL